MSYELYRNHRLAPDDNGCWSVLTNPEYKQVATYPSKAAAKRAVDEIEDQSEPNTGVTMPTLSNELKKYDQLITGGKDSLGDCFRASMATVLQMEPSDLPNWHDNMWFLKWDKWLHERGLEIKLHSFYYGVEGYWVASVKSQNYKDTTHAVVMYDDKLYHDPSPKKKFTKIDTDDVVCSYHIVVADIEKLFATQNTALLKEVADKVIGADEEYEVIDKDTPLWAAPVESQNNVNRGIRNDFKAKQRSKLAAMGGQL